jgi:nucleoid-associated protein YgaU
MRLPFRIAILGALLLVPGGVALAQQPGAGTAVPPYLRPPAGEPAPGAGGRTVTNVTLVPNPAKPEEEPNTYENVGGVHRSGGAAPAPEFHRVQRGDTLWRICGDNLGNAWLWPKVWSMNPSITNPHWIYPDDRIRLRPASAVTAPAPALKPYTARTERPGTIYLKYRGYIEEEDVPHAAKIVGAREEKILLATYDHIYVRYPAGKPLKVGERYSIYKAVEEVKHPHLKRTLGRVVEIYGEVEIKELSRAHVARGVILRAVNPVERGFLVGKLTKVYDSVTPVPNTRTQVSGSVIAIMDHLHLVGTRQLIFIDRGKKFAVKTGYTFYVVRRGDSYQRGARLEYDPRRDQRQWPREYVAQVVVVDVGWNHAVGYVATALKEIRVGDQVELKVDAGGTR